MDTAAGMARGVFLQLQLQPDGNALILAGLAAAAFGAGDTGVCLFEHLFGAGHVAQTIAFAEMRVGFFRHERTGDGFHDGLLRVDCQRTEIRYKKTAGRAVREPYYRVGG